MSEPRFLRNGGEEEGDFAEPRKDLLELDLHHLEKDIEQELKKVNLPEDIESALNKISSWLDKLFLHGVQRCSKDTLDELQALSITAHNTKVSRLERDVQALKSVLENYLNKDSSFSFKKLTSIMSRIALTAKAIKDYKNGKQLSPNLVKLLVGAKEEKKSHDLIIAQTLGIGGWLTESGFVGVTAYFYDFSNQQIITATNARPLTSLRFYQRGYGRSSKINKDLRIILAIYRFETNSGFSMEYLERAAFQIKECKLNPAKYPIRLSLSKNLKVSPYKPISWKASEFDNIRFDDWSEVHLQILEIEGQGITLFPQAFGLFEIEAFSKMEYDEVEKEYSFSVYDKNYASMNVKISNEGKNEYLIESFKRMYNAKNMPPVIFGMASLREEGELGLWPISGIWPHGLMLPNDVLIDAWNFQLEQLRI